MQAALHSSEPLLAAELVGPLSRVARLDGYLTEIMTLSAPWRDVSEVKDMRQQLHVLLA